LKIKIKKKPIATVGWYLAKSIEQEKLAKYKVEMQDVRQLFINATGAFFVIWYNSTG
jgi:hypothetical protein